jgi:hypothetical protein
VYPVNEHKGQAKYVAKLQKTLQYSFKIIQKTHFEKAASPLDSCYRLNTKAKLPLCLIKHHG